MNTKKYLRIIFAMTILLGLVLVGGASASADKVEVCHRTDNGSYILINISDNAFPSHVDHGDGSPGDPVPGMAGYVFDSECNVVLQKLHSYGVDTSPSQQFADGGWAGWSVPAGNVVLGGGFQLTGGPAAVSAPGTPGSIWPHYTYGPAEYGWVVQDNPDGANSYGSFVYAVHANMPAGYEVVKSGPMSFGDGGYGGWSCPAGKVVLGGGYSSTGRVSVSAPGTPGSVWPHYTYGAAEYGWVVRDVVDGVGNTITVYAICSYPLSGYQVLKSGSEDYGDGGWAGWSCPAGKVVTGGGYELTGSAAAASAPGTPNSAWPHHNYGSAEYGWVVQDAIDGATSWGSTVYAICAIDP